MKFAAVSSVVIVLLVASLVGGQRPWNRVTQPKDYKRWQWYLSDTRVSMNVKSAWNAGYTGSGVLVAVVDDGVNINHPDLRSNVNLNASYDFLDNRKISVRYSPGSHGTKCAGIIAGENNNNCGVGVAYNAQISSIRLYDDNRRSTDRSEAQALSFKRDMVDIYSNSWGPGDMGWQVAGPGPELKKAIVDGTRLGRGGKGSIFVFAAGNGGIAGDSCAFSGYVNDIHTIAISGVNWDGAVPAYSEQCSAIMAVTYGQDIFDTSRVKFPLITASGRSACSERFTGTSGTAAMASGIAALALQANPNLTWRDVQHLIARSSKPLNPPKQQHSWGRRVHRRPTPVWKTNKAGLRVSSHYGFGLMDAEFMVKYAKQWRSVPEQLSCEIKLDVSNSSRLVIPRDRRKLRLTISLTDQHNCSIRYLEHVQAEINVRYPRRGYLEMFSTSPSGTESKILYPRMIDGLTGKQSFSGLRVTSLHYWGENPTGDWKITIGNAKRWRVRNDGRVFGLKLVLFGTKDNPLANNTHVDRRTKKIDEVNVNRRKREIPVDGGYSRWSYWSWCSRRCGGGTQQRSRTCTNPSPQNGGRDCSGLGPATESRRCNTHRCPVDGKWGPWGRWSPCDVTCGLGSQHRYRRCNNPAPAHGGRDCDGRHTDTRRCQMNTCPPGSSVDGGYSRWSYWSVCSRKCGGGTQQRSRTCTNPSPQNGGKDCSDLGPATQSRRCNTHRCQGRPGCSNIQNDHDCQRWARNGYCISNSGVQHLCKKTCGLCRRPVCRNRAGDDQCEDWENQGYDCFNQSFSYHCQKTCGLC